MNVPSTTSLAAMLLAGAMLSSCVYYSNPVPEMPYRPRRHSSAPAIQPVAPAATPAAPATPASALPQGVTPPKPAAPKPAAPKPATPPASSGHHITQPAGSGVTPIPRPTAQPTPTPTPPASATPPTPTEAQPALISNDGPIPVATRVPGDPLRVYNPLDPSKTIKITDKNGNPYPSGKKLRVPKTNFYFYVP